MKFFKTNWVNILFLLLLALILFTPTGMPIRVFVLRLIAVSPSEIKKENVEYLKDFDWQLKNFSSEKISLEKSKGKVIIINQWATWCPPCVAEMPSFQKLYDTYGTKADFYFVTEEKAQTVQKFITNKNFNLPIYFPDGPSPDKLKSTVLPTTYIISKNGEILLRETGVANWDSQKVHLLLDKLLKE